MSVLGERQTIEPQAGQRGYPQAIQGELCIARYLDFSAVPFSFMRTHQIHESEIGRALCSGVCFWIPSGESQSWAMSLGHMGSG